MVYESDFYTTRRPYRPSYSASMVQTFNHLPYIAHKKVVTMIHTPYPVIYHKTSDTIPITVFSRVRRSAINAELQRIQNQIRPTTISYVSRYLNSKDTILFDDEAREIRARADSILRRIHVHVPRPSASDFVEAIIPERLRSDDYIRRILTARKNTKEEKIDSWYGSPEHHHLGNGNLAAITYSAGKPISRRRPYYKVSDLRPADIQNDVNLLSFYAKHRHAAASILLQRKLDEDELRRQINKLKRLAEERWKAEIEERVRLEEEARQLRLLEINDQERVEAFRQAEEEKIEATRLQERNLAEEKRHAIEVESEKIKNVEANEITHNTRKQKEEEEVVGEELSFDEILRIGNDLMIGELKLDDECHCYSDFNDRDFEERPESPDADDDTQIEEEGDCEQIKHEEDAHLCDGEHENLNHF